MLNLEDPALQAAMQTIVLSVLSLLGTVITGAVAWMASYAKQWLEGKAHAATFQCAVNKLETVTKNAVDEVEQTLVRQLKADGKWNAETAREARDTAVDVAKRQLGEKGMEELEGCLGHAREAIEGMLRTYVEKQVRGHGNSGSDSPIVAMGK